MIAADKEKSVLLFVRLDFFLVDGKKYIKGKELQIV
jgi:hypothetical protein